MHAEEDRAERDDATMKRAVVLSLLVILTATTVTFAAGCAQTDQTENCGCPRVVTTATFLADIAQNVAGDRFTVESLLPLGADLHSYQPMPRDISRVAAADVFIMNGFGLEGALEDTARNAGGSALYVEAAEGLTPRTPQPGEPLHDDEEEAPDEDAHVEDGDPHFWLDPTLAIRYVENIRDAFIQVDPNGATAYEANAVAYIAELKELDTWIEKEVRRLPPDRRLLVMNHISHGYFADRYGFHILGAVIPSPTSGDSPSARQLAGLTASLKTTGVKAIFVGAHEDSKLAQQIADEAGVEVVDDLLDHSLTGSDGVAPTYIEMMKFDTLRIVETLL
jgi:ABC-type Zn uptake system ZnuABC Zn-binding protein ZnuA